MPVLVLVEDEVLAKAEAGPRARLFTTVLSVTTEDDRVRNAR